MHLDTFGVYMWEACEEHCWGGDQRDSVNLFGALSSWRNSLMSDEIQDEVTACVSEEPGGVRSGQDCSTGKWAADIG